MGITMSADFSRLKRDLKSLGDFKPRVLNEKIGELLVSSTIKRFEDEEAPDGTKWDQSIRAKNDGGKTLTDNKHLKGSIHHHASAAGVEVGTNLIYAGVHQNGMEIKPKTAKFLRFQIGGQWSKKRKVTIPKRPFLGISDDDMEEIDATIMEHVGERLK